MARFRKGEFIAKIRNMGYPVRKIAVLLYGEDSEQSQKRVWAHISKFMKRMRIMKILRNATGSGSHVKDLR